MYLWTILKNRREGAKSSEAELLRSTKPKAAREELRGTKQAGNKQQVLIHSLSKTAEMHFKENNPTHADWAALNRQKPAQEKLPGWSGLRTLVGQGQHGTFLAGDCMDLSGDSAKLNKSRNFSGGVVACGYWMLYNPQTYI